MTRLRLAFVLVLGAALTSTAGCSGSEPRDEPRPRAAAPAEPVVPSETGPLPPIPDAPRPTDPTCALTPGETDGPDAAAADVPARVRLGPGGQVPANTTTVSVARKGEPMLFTGVIYDEDCKPLAGATVYGYQTASDGYYGPPRGAGEPPCCYLQGTVRTDSAGRYAFDTVVPGVYPDPSPPPRHVHLEISHPSAMDLTTEAMIAGDPGVDADEPLAVPLDGPEGNRLMRFDVVLRRR